MGYRPVFSDGRAAPWPLGKIVCVGRNYADHARELDNAVPDEPLLFIKPATAAVAFSERLDIPARFADPHYETEMAVLVGQALNCGDSETAMNAVAGLGIGLDLTLRTLQERLKQRGHPWERAKAFDGSCVLSPFVPFHPGINLHQLAVRLWRNGDLVQDGNTEQMVFSMIDLLCAISAVFTLEPGDVVMTGTPAGVGQLENGDRLRAELDNLVAAECRVVVT